MQVTRKRIIDYLRRHGQATVEELTKTIGLTHMAVRHHLNVLQSESLVEVVTMRRDHRPGRPIQIYALTDDAERLYPQDYFHLTDLLLEEMIEQIGPAGVTDLFNRIAERLLEVAPSPWDGQPFEKRLDEVVEFLKDKGFVARWEVEDGQYVIHHLACPYRQLATRHQEVCLLDEFLIGSMLEVAPKRTCSIAENDEMCTYCLGVSVESKEKVGK
jgi:predicted ArsR family transcriptional regulator